jgi:hypothetical protein
MSDTDIAKAAMWFFASLVKDPGADEAYKTRYIELHGGSPSDKICVECGKVGDFDECTKCNAVYVYAG